ncbi:HAD family hydrolase [Nocardioides bruguierae]|uniref:HAD family hydrolase n=1 Tax=Nocardioides bruguierae TaxID=2945102 RepID=UPI00202040AB|nr:HAD-IA family hydrolase [Nocardioides bruguierae]MCL8027108.1 HAD-IA family hydrolase [Nocardioides bruguierae]
MTGRLAPLHLFEAVLAGAGRDVAQASGLVVRDAALLVEHAVVHHDTVPFLTALRQRGVRTALVSNCAPNARTLLEATGLDDLVDAVILSCEVGSAKPDAGIYRAALTALDVPAGDALLVDDQAGYCEGAREVGIDAVRITRGQPPRPGEVASLLELLDLF